MALVKYNDYLPSWSAWSNLFNDFLNRDWNDWSLRNFSDTNTTIPSVNIKETDEVYQVDMAAPGMVKNDFKIELNNDVLTISSEKKEESKEKENEQFTRREFSYQSFSRAFTLPANVVDSDKIAAKYHDGILSVTIPKKEEAKPKPAKQIAIS